jgi:SAM-dependent methyltransferase/uncharacterized protein YbaR (Trm112 family)
LVLKLRFLELAACPHCGGKLRLRSFNEKKISFSAGEEARLRAYCAAKKLEVDGFKRDVVEGVLECSCGRWFPIVGSVPRLLSDDLFDEFVGKQKAFLKKHAARLPKKMRSTKLADSAMQLKTGESFGFQWKAFREMYPEYEKNFLNYVAPLQPLFFKNKVVLDAGCGFGRHSFYAAKYGAEVVALDLSDAVEAARDNLASFALAHVVQGDVYRPPLQRKFDFVFSIGVLHHLPNPEDGFRALTALLRPGDEIFVWVYGRENRAFKTKVMERIHAITKHLPHKVLYVLCVFPALLYHSVNLLYKALKRVGLTGLAEKLPFKYYANFPFRVKHADAFDFLSTQVNNYYSREEFRAWFERARLKNIRVTSFLGRSWRGFATK